MRVTSQNMSVWEDRAMQHAASKEEGGKAYDDKRNI